MKYIIEIILIYIISLSVNASTVEWDIQFFDGNGIQVGDGEFSYDPETIEIFTAYFDDPLRPPLVVEQNTSFTHLNWTILDKSWDFAFNSWWIGSLIDTGRVDPYIGPLFLGTPVAGTDLMLHLTDISTSGIQTGIWSGTTIGGGDWIASSRTLQVVPIPSVLLLFGSGLISMLIMGAKTKK